MCLFRNNPVNTLRFFLRQTVFLLPLLLMLAGVTLYCGDERPIRVFREVRAQNISAYKVVQCVSLYGNYFGYCIYAVYLGLAVIRRDALAKWFVFYYVAVQVTLTLFTVHMFKRVLGRPRPFMGESEWRFFNGENQYHSFPSGHTAEISGAIGPFAQMAKNLLVSFAWGIIPAAMGFARIFLGEHHRTDVFAGALVGSLTTYCILFLTLRKKRQLEEEIGVTPQGFSLKAVEKVKKPLTMPEASYK